MLDRSIIEAGHSGVKRAPDSVSENTDVSLPKITVTPRTRSKVMEETPPKKIIPVPAPRSSIYVSSGPVTRTPIHTPKINVKENLTDTLNIPETRSRSRSNTPVTRRSRSNTPVITVPVEVSGTGKRSRSKTPVTPEVQRSRRRSRSNTPVIIVPVDVSGTKRSRSKTPVTPEVQGSGKRSRSNIPVASNNKNSRSKELRNTPAPVTPKSTKPTSRSSKSKCVQKMADDESSTRTPRNRARNTLVFDQTPKIPHKARTPRSQILVNATPKECKVSQQKSSSRTPVLKISNVTEKQMQNNRRKSLCSANKEHTNDIKENVEQSSSQDALDFRKNIEPLVRPSSSSSCDDMNTPSEGGETSPIDSTAPECSEELEKELDKVKKRRSTLGRGRRSGQSLGGRKSLCAAIPMLSLEDQIANIDKNLPKTSKVSHLLDISIRETMRSFEERFIGEQCISDLRLEIITNSEVIGGHIAYTIAGMPLEVDSCLLKKTKDDTDQRYDKISAYKNKTKELEQEYKCWKSLVKERKLACQAAEREYREAKSGETKIEEDTMKQLTTVHRKILAGRPNYNQYIKEVQMAREKTFFVMREVNHTANVISHFITASKAVADTCYATVEEMTLGPLKQQPVKSALKTLLSLEVT